MWGIIESLFCVLVSTSIILILHSSMILVAGIVYYFPLSGAQEGSSNLPNNFSRVISSYSLKYTGFSLVIFACAIDVTVFMAVRYAGLQVDYVWIPVLSVMHLGFLVSVSIYARFALGKELEQKSYLLMQNCARGQISRTNLFPACCDNRIDDARIMRTFERGDRITALIIGTFCIAATFFFYFVFPIWKAHLG